MAAIFDTENNEFSQDDYVVPVFAVNDDSGVSYRLHNLLQIIEYRMFEPCSCFEIKYQQPDQVPFLDLFVFLSELHFRIPSKRA